MPQMTPEQHQQASEELLHALQNLIEDATIPGGGMVNSYIMMCEVIDSNGNSSVKTLYSDNRTHLLLGLLSYGQTVIAMGMGGPPE